MQGFIDRSFWQFAKTMARIPHEYTVREWTDNEQEFMDVVQHIRDEGVPEQFWSKRYIYLYVGDWKYWSMGFPLDETTIINRART